MFYFSHSFFAIFTPQIVASVSRFQSLLSENRIFDEKFFLLKRETKLRHTNIGRYIRALCAVGPCDLSSFEIASLIILSPITFIDSYFARRRYGSFIFLFCHFQIETRKLDFKDKAQSKVGSKDNIKHQAGGGDKKVRDYSHSHSLYAIAILLSYVVY